MKIARRFNAGCAVKKEKVPKGRLNHIHARNRFSRPFGTRHFGDDDPALKCRAIFKCPFGTGKQGTHVFVIVCFHNILKKLYYFAFGSGAASSSCALRGPVRVGIPVISPS